MACLTPMIFQEIVKKDWNLYTPITVQEGINYAVDKLTCVSLSNTNETYIQSESKNE